MRKKIVFAVVFAILILAVARLGFSENKKKRKILCGQEVCA